MPTRTSLRAIATLAAAAAATGVAVVAAAPAASASSTRPTLIFVAGPHRMGVSTHAVHPGLIHVRNRGHHAVAALIPRHGATLTTLVRDLKAGSGADQVRDFAIADVVSAGSAGFFTVPRGRFFIVDATRASVSAANVATIRVTGARVDDPAPRPVAVTITAAHEVPAPQVQTVPTESYLRVSNRAPRIHALVLLTVRSGVPTAAVRHFVRHPSPAGFAKVVKFGNGPRLLTILSRHRSALVHYHVSAGRYLLWDIPETGPGSRHPFGHHFALLIAKS